MSRPPHHQGPLPGISELDTMGNATRSLDFTRENIGRAVTFSEGPFAGLTIRAELTELQKADLGRKYARKDRRPLDPPPVVQLKLLQLKHQGTPFERFEEYERYDEAQGLGLVCHIDLFPVPAQDDHPDPAASPHKRRKKSPSASRPTTASTPAASVSPTPAPSMSSPSYTYTHSAMSSSPPAYNAPPPPPSQHGTSMSTQYGYPSPQPATTSSSYPHTPPAQASASGGITLPPISQLSGPPPVNVYPGSSLQLPPMQAQAFSRAGLTLPPLPRGPPPPPHALSYSFPPPPPPPAQPPALHPPLQPSTGTGGDVKAVRAGPDAPDGVVAYLGGYGIREDSKCTDSLSGACFAQSQSLEYHGRKVLMFVFSDIAVRIEGTFILRYRVFNIFARADGVDIPILAECYGGPFRIYSTKEFPGLRPSTDLTKHLSLFGVRLNLRETERKRRRGGPSSEAEGTSGATRGRRRRRAHRGEDEESDEGSGAGSGDETE
ncbi:velvet factor-domain-containing protein [Cytidiella melzeri]|nr:velvet factor-domain-containing protein [Cytidiella melzeri]